MKFDALKTPSEECSRRKFMGTLCKTAAGLLLAPSIKSINGDACKQNVGSPYLAQVALTQAANYDRALIKRKIQHLFDSIGGIGDVVKAGQKVALKINLVGGSGSAFSPKLKGVPITESMWTHPEVVRAVAELMMDSGVHAEDIYIVESLWDDASYNNFGYRDVQQSLGVKMVNLNSEYPYADFVQKQVGENQFYYSSFTLNRILNDVDVYVSLPKMKQHSEAGISGSLKNQIGIVPKSLYTMPSDQGRRAALHVQGGQSNAHLPRSICDLNFARPVHLAVVDGIGNAKGGEGVWNPNFQPAENHVLLAGKNPVATDSVVSVLMGNNPEAAKLQLPGSGTCDNYLEMLHQKGMGTNRMSEIEPVGDGAELMTSVVPVRTESVPSDFQLYQNFPNPFNPSTVIPFYLPRAEFTRIRLFDVTGRQLEVLVERTLSAGRHEIRWTPKHLSGGVYLVQMQAGNHSDTKRIIYQK